MIGHSFDSPFVLRLSKDERLVQNRFVELWIYDITSGWRGLLA